MARRSPFDEYDDEDFIGGAGIGFEQAENIGEELSFRTDPEVGGTAGGVSVAWLMKAFRLGRLTVEKRMIGCPSIGRGKHGSPLYDLPEAASYLMTPMRSIASYLEDVRVEDLPEKMRESYWNSKLKQQRFEEKAKELWRTEMVIDKLSEVLQNIRSQLQLIPDGAERIGGITPKQHKIVVELVEDVQEQIYQYILNLGESSFTPNSMVESEDDLI